MRKPTRSHGEEDCFLGDASLDFPCPPSTPPIVTTAVYRCESTGQADRMLDGTESGYVYQRDGHPNADWLAAKLAKLHRLPRAAVTSSGMAALSAAMLSVVKAGDRVVASDQLYGRSSLLLAEELPRWGVTVDEVDVTDLDQVRESLSSPAQAVVVETISNPRLRIPDLPALAELAHAQNAVLVVDNTFATPLVCRPGQWGADFVYESLSKLMNGHGDLMLGGLLGTEAVWDRVPRVIACWGLASAPFDCWLAERGLATLGLRIARACDNAMAVAELLTREPCVRSVDYPGLASHPDHALAKRMFADPSGESQAWFGHVVTFRLAQDGAADRLVRGLVDAIPFCPSLGEIRTTLSHPASTSHRSLTPAKREELGIGDGTIRLSLGIETAEWICDRLGSALASLDR